MARFILQPLFEHFFQFPGQIFSSRALVFFIFFLDKPFELIAEAADIRKFPIHRGKPDIGHLIECLELFPNQGTDLLGRYLLFHGIAKLTLDIINERREILHGDIQLITGPDQSVQ